MEGISPKTYFNANRERAWFLFSLAAYLFSISAFLGFIPINRTPQKLIVVGIVLILSLARLTACRYRLVIAESCGVMNKRINGDHEKNYIIIWLIVFIASVVAFSGLLPFAHTSEIIVISGWVAMFSFAGLTRCRYRLIIARIAEIGDSSESSKAHFQSTTSDPPNTEQGGPKSSFGKVEPEKKD